MTIKEGKKTTDAQDTVSVSVKGILSPVSQALKDVSQARKVNQSVLLREMVNGPMSSLIHVFCLKSPLVNSLDQEIAKFAGSWLQPILQTVPMAAQFDAAYRDLLDIRTEDDLTRILMHNARFINIRASQVLVSGTPIMGGASVYFALFCEVASRDEETIEAFWTSIARHWGAWYLRQHFYQQINQLRSLSGLPPASTLSKASARGVYARVEIVKEESDQAGLSQVLMTLRPENAKRVPAENFERFWIPTCGGHLLVPDVGYAVPMVISGGGITPGFRFKEEICSLHCYTVEDERISPVQTLTEVADALIAAVDNALSPFAKTFGADV